MSFKVAVQETDDNESITASGPTLFHPGECQEQVVVKMLSRIIFLIILID